MPAVGLLDGVKSLLGARPPSLVPTSAPSAPPAKAEGIPGGGNMSGRLLFEPNDALREQAGYGRAGTYDVGQWQEILLGNPFVTMALDHVLRPIADARVDVEPAAPESGVDKATATLHADFVRWCLTEKFHLSSLSKQAAQGFLLSGFALFEPLAEECAAPMVPGRTVFALRAVEQRLPNSLDANPWQVDDEGRLVGIRQLGPRGMGGSWARPTLGASRALLFSWKRDAGNFAGVSQLRSCWYLAGRVMPRLMKMVGVTLQREGPGVPVAYTDDAEASLTPEQQEDIVRTFADLSAHESSGLVLPAGWRVEWAVSPAANKGHVVDVVVKMGTWILMQFGAQQLMLGVNGEGNRSVGETHDARSMAMVREVLGFLGDGYNGARGEADGLVKKLVDWNFGPQPAYPKVKLTPQRPELAPADLASAAKAAKDAGLFTPTCKDENSFRERAGFAPITEEEREEAKEATRALAPAMPGADVGTEDDAEPPSGETELPEDEEQDGPAAGARKEGAPSRRNASVAPNRRLSASAQRGGWMPWRPLRASEAKMELAAIDEYLTRARDEYERQARPEVLGLLAMSAPAIQGAMADGTVTPEEVAAVPLDEKRLLAANRKYLASVRARGFDFARKELATGKPLRAAAEDEQDDKDTAQQVTDDADEVTEAQAKALTRRQLNRLRGELEREAIDVLRTGGDASEVVARTVARQLETGAFKADAGTVTAKVLNVGRDEAARLIGGVAEVEYTAILDSATCGDCRAADGQTARFNSPEHDRLLPPNRDCAGGDNCRCLLAFIPAEGDDE